MFTELESDMAAAFTAGEVDDKLPAWSQSEGVKIYGTGFNMGASTVAFVVDDSKSATDSAEFDLVDFRFETTLLCCGQVWFRISTCSVSGHGSH